jgi:hypothetical protein
VLNGNCASDDSDSATDEGIFDVSSSSDTCTSEATYTGKHACITASIPIARYMDLLAPFFGAILIIIGLAMLLKGSYFLHLVVGLMVGTVATIIFFSIGYSLMPTSQLKFGTLIGVLVLCIILGGLVAYLSFRFT